MASNPSLANLRRDARVKLSLNCRIEGPDFETSTTIDNLSRGGAGVVISSGLAWFDFSKIHRIHIDEIGSFDVTFRWRGTDRLGVSFNSTDLARRRIGKYFRENGIESG